MMINVTGSTSGYDRAELDAFWNEWAAATVAAQRAGDWAQLARFYAADASYGWSCSPTDHFMATGIDEIREWALGAEMHGFQGWTYPYQAVVIDDRSGQVVAFWRETTTFTDPDGRPYETPGIGCSWFQYAGNRQWAWHRDVYDVAVAGSVLIRVLQDGRATRALAQRMQTAAEGDLPGHVSSPDAGGTPMWPVPTRTDRT